MNRAYVTTDGTFCWHCPGCKGGHGVPVVGGRAWGWNQSLENPTLTPSVLIFEHERHEAPNQPRCHCFIRDGKIEFLTDCTHELAGQTLEMEPDV